VPPVRISRPGAALARGQAAWIAAIEPWRGLGYGPAALGRFLARKAAARKVWIARIGGREAPTALVVAEDGFLLGGFISLLAVRPEASRQGLGRALVGRVEREIFPRRRWLFVSCDGKNAAALRFYKKLGFVRVGRLPDLIRPGNVEVLLRKPSGQSASGRPRSAKIPAGAPRVGYHRGRS
jgi:ribosomal protein S18 acetylase RimI-like enzyme